MVEQHGVKMNIEKQNQVQNMYIMQRDGINIGKHVSQMEVGHMEVLHQNYVSNHHIIKI